MVIVLLTDVQTSNDYDSVQVTQRSVKTNVLPAAGLTLSYTVKSEPFFECVESR